MPNGYFHPQTRCISWITLWSGHCDDLSSVCVVPVSTCICNYFAFIYIYIYIYILYIYIYIYIYIYKIFNTLQILTLPDNCAWSMEMNCNRTKIT